MAGNRLRLATTEHMERLSNRTDVRLCVVLLYTTLAFFVTFSAIVALTNVQLETRELVAQLHDKQAPPPPIKVTCPEFRVEETGETEVTEEETHTNVTLPMTTVRERLTYVDFKKARDAEVGVLAFGLVLVLWVMLS